MKKLLGILLSIVLMVSVSFADTSVVGVPGGTVSGDIVLPSPFTFTFGGLTASRPLSLNSSGVAETLTIANYRILLGLGTSDSPAFTGLTLTGSGTIPYIPVLTKTDSYPVTTSDFGKSLRMNAGSAKVFTLPSVATAQDGARVTFVKQGAGNLTITASDSDKIYDSSAGGSIANTTAGEIGATITLEYVDAIVTWVIISAFGTWTTS